MTARTAHRIAFTLLFLAIGAAFCRDAYAEQKYSDGDEGGNVLWEVSVGQTYRFIERDFTGGTNVAVTMYSQSREWRLSLGVITGQLLHNTHNIDHLIGPKGTGISSTGFGFDTLGIQRHIHLHLDVKPYAYLTGQYVKYFREGRMLQPFLAFGPSLHDKVFPVEGGYLSWASSLGLGIGDHFGVEFRHNSNAGLWLPNWGQNVASLTWRF